MIDRRTIERLGLTVMLWECDVGLLLNGGRHLLRGMEAGWRAAMDLSGRRVPWILHCGWPMSRPIRT